jgi:transposase
MIFNAHQYFFDVRQCQNQQQTLTLRKQVAMVLGIGEATVAQVVSEQNKKKNQEFSTQKKSGRPKKYLDQSISELIRGFITTANTSGTPISTNILRQKLAENNHELSKWQLLRILHILGYYYGQGERRNMLHESPVNVAFRNCYLRRRFENLQGKNKVPTRPEVFLDESYCHLHHTTNHTWVPNHGVVYSPGRGPLIIIFGAIIVMRNGNTNKLYGEIIPNSILMWDPSIKPPSSRGRKRTNADAWNDVPEVIRNSNLAANHVDYYGNFTAEIFEDLFEKLCINIMERYGPVDIHMDGACYHKRRIEQVPTSNSKKDVLMAWLSSADINVPENSSKAELYELVKKNKHNIPFACIEIAKKYNHNLFYTPPYHCELQPIEGVWSVVKGEVARSGPHSNLLAIRDKLLYAFQEKVTVKVIIGFWERSLNKATEYHQSSDDVQLIESDDDDFEVEEISD